MARQVRRAVEVDSEVFKRLKALQTPEHPSMNQLLRHLLHMPNMSDGRQKVKASIKADAVRRYRRGEPIATILRRAGVSHVSLYRWLHQRKR
jgi:hypothetical protein